MAEQDYRIGQLASAAGVNVQTVRYYQRRGLLEVPPRPALGYRRYSKAALGRLQFIKRAQALGFTLKEIQQLVELADGRCADVQRLAQAKQADIAQRIDDLIRLRRALDEALAACRQDNPESRCPLIEALSHPE